VHNFKKKRYHRHHQPFGSLVALSIYAQTLTQAQRVEMTEIDLDVNGDAFAPKLGQEWREIHREEHISSKGVPFRFLTFNRF
jgi:dihydrofolate reductase